MNEKDKPKKRYFNYQLLYRRTALIIYDILSITAAVSYTHLDVYKRQAAGGI